MPEHNFILLAFVTGELDDDTSAEFDVLTIKTMDEDEEEEVLLME